jgi:glycosyltransferase involved in cell wall biosynthesis
MPVQSPPIDAEPLAILHVLDHVRDEGNGIVNVVVDLACAQADAGHRVAVVSGGGDYEPLLAAHAVDHHALIRRDSWVGRARVLARLNEIVGRVRPAVLNAHRAYATVAGRLLRRRHGFALIATDHNEFEGKGRLLGLADLIVAVSEGAAASLAAGGVSREWIRVVANGPLFGARHSRPGSGDAALARPAVVTVAGLVPRKGVHVLLDAFETVAGAHAEANLYFVGEGSERAALDARRRESRFAERIHLVGFQPEPAGYLRAADVFVLASLREPFGLAALEARGAGCAVVVTSVDGLPETVDHGESGIIVPPGDADALAGVLAGLLQDPAELAGWRERAGRGLERFSAERMARDTVAVYREALERATPRG